MAESTATYSLKYPARALCPVLADKKTSQWLVGTNSLREENEVHYITYEPQSDTVSTMRSFIHEPEIWDIAPCPSSSDMFITVWSKVGGTHGASLWQTGGADCSLHLKADFGGHTSPLRHALWHPSAARLVLTIEEGAIRKWDVEGAKAECTGEASPGELQLLWSGALASYSPDLAATAGGNNVQLWDLRTMALAGDIQDAHKMPTRDVCFPHAEGSHRLVSCGDDCKIKFWDTRAFGRAEPLLELPGHSHWVWKAQYNPFHPSLLASASSDASVCLWFTPILAAAKDAAQARAAISKAAAASPAVAAAADVDGRVHEYDEHDDSVYALAWSSVDPWLLASLSYDGRLVVSRVPKGVKYKVLL